jgi:hypothetical protein
VYVSNSSDGGLGASILGGRKDESIWFWKLHRPECSKKAQLLIQPLLFDLGFGVQERKGVLVGAKWGKWVLAGLTLILHYSAQLFTKLTSW